MPILKCYGCIRSDFYRYIYIKVRLSKLTLVKDDQGVMVKKEILPSRDSHVKPPENSKNYKKTKRVADKQAKKEISLSNLSYLKPKDTIHLNGRLCYKESLRAWNIIHLQQEILDLFPELRQRRELFGYSMFYSRKPKEAKKIMEKLEREGVVPILLLLGKVKEN